MDHSVPELEERVRERVRKEKIRIEYEPRPDRYSLDHHQERTHPLSYVPPHTYAERFHKERRDILRFTPCATVKRFPREGHEGLYGWTFRNKDGSVNIREDLQGYTKLETDLHECEHTPDEQETRYRTEEYYDAIRRQFLQEQGFKAEVQQIDRRITAMNNVIIGIPIYSN